MSLGLRVMGAPTNGLMVFGCRGHPALTRGVCGELDCEPGALDIFEYGNDNTFVRILDNVREADVFVVQTSRRPVNQFVMEMLITIDALRRASAARVTAVMPYFPYMRSDKKDQPRVPITARLVADLLATAGADRVLTLDLHADQIGGFFSIPGDHLSGMPLLTSYFEQQGFDDLVVVGDTGRIKTASECARRLMAPLAVLDKYRDPITSDVTVRGLVGDVRGRTVLYVEDEVATGQSLREGLREITRHKPRAAYAACVHPVFLEQAYEMVEQSPLEAMVVTDSIPLAPGRPHTKIKVLSIAPLLAEAIRRIHTGESVSALFAERAAGWSQPTIGV